jgi:hypothetical protein
MIGMLPWTAGAPAGGFSGAERAPAGEAPAVQEGAR